MFILFFFLLFYGPAKLFQIKILSPIHVGACNVFKFMLLQFFCFCFQALMLRKDNKREIFFLIFRILTNRLNQIRVLG